MISFLPGLLAAALLLPTTQAAESDGDDDELSRWERVRQAPPTVRDIHVEETHLPGQDSLRRSPKSPAPHLRWPLRFVETGYRFAKGRNDNAVRTAMEHDESGLMAHVPVTRNWVERVPLDRAVLAEDAWRVELWYAHHGYFDAEVQGVELRQVKPRPMLPGLRFPNLRGPVVDVVIVVDEGPVSTIHAIEVEGLEGISPAALGGIRRYVKDLEGDPFTVEEPQALERYVAAELHGLGYARATAEVSVEAYPEERRVDIRVRAEPGEICMFGEVTIVGAEGVAERFVQEQIRVVPGERYDPQALSATQRNLFSLATFSSVQVRPDLEAPGQVLPVEVLLTETTFRELRVGPGFGIRTDGGGSEVRGTARFEHTNFLKRLIRAEAEVQGGYRIFTNDLVGEVTEDGQDVVSDAQSAIDGGPFVSTDLGLIYPHVFGLERWTHLPTVGFDRVFKEDVKSWEVEMAPRFRYQATPHLSLTPGYRWNWFLIDELDPGASLSFDEQPYHIHRVELSTVWDHRKPLLRPQRGHYVELYTANAGAFLPGTTFVEARLDLRKYVTLSFPSVDLLRDFRPVLAGRVVGGAMLPYGETKPGEVPYRARYFLGGSTSLRGFSQDQAGPLACRVYNVDQITNTRELVSTDCSTPARRRDQEVDVDALGGEAILYSNLEARIPLPGDWADLVVFQDTGWTWSTVTEVDLRELQPGAGLGLRVASPAGPIRLDWGVRLIDDPNYVNDQRLRHIYFALQETF